ncbi:MAG: hypothetical protein M1335_04565 [Chloroflexi bacterium]|nr:hypothetical protein [Chloroflexota bacterium]
MGKKGKGSESTFSYTTYAPNAFLRSKDKTILNLLAGGRSYIYHQNEAPGDLVDPILRLLSDEEHVYAASHDFKLDIVSSPVTEIDRGLPGRMLFCLVGHCSLA